MAITERMRACLVGNKKVLTLLERMDRGGRLTPVQKFEVATVVIEQLTRSLGAARAEAQRERFRVDFLAANVTDLEEKSAAHGAENAELRKQLDSMLIKTIRLEKEADARCKSGAHRVPACSVPTQFCANCELEKADMKVSRLREQIRVAVRAIKRLAIELAQHAQSLPSAATAALVEGETPADSGRRILPKLIQIEGVLSLAIDDSSSALSQPKATTSPNWLPAAVLVAGAGLLGVLVGGAVSKGAAASAGAPADAAPTPPGFPFLPVQPFFRPPTGS